MTWAALTIRQPWAWSTWQRRGKTTENRSGRSTGAVSRWSWSGHVMLHAGQGWSLRGAADERVRRLWVYGGSHVRTDVELQRGWFEFGVIGAVCRIDGVHHADPGCCADPWAEWDYVDASGERTSNIVHLPLVDVVELPHPVPAKGRLGHRSVEHALGLWYPTQTVIDAVEAQLA